MYKKPSEEWNKEWWGIGNWLPCLGGTHCYLIHVKMGLVYANFGLRYGFKECISVIKRGLTVLKKDKTY